MSEFSLEALALNATVNNNSARNSTAVYTLSVEDARARVTITDGNKTPKDDQSQSLTLKLGGIIMTLSAIKPNATRINVAGEAVEGTTEALLAFVADGTFDADIADAQAKGKEAAEKKIETNRLKREKLAAAGVDADVAGDVDLDAIDADGEAVESNEVDDADLG